MNAGEEGKRQINKNTRLQYTHMCVCSTTGSTFRQLRRLGDDGGGACNFAHVSKSRLRFQNTRKRLVNERCWIRVSGPRSEERCTTRAAMDNLLKSETSARLQITVAKFFLSFPLSLIRTVGR